MAASQPLPGTDAAARPLARVAGARPSTGALAAWLPRLLPLAIAVGLGFAVRLIHVAGVGQGFPLNDGGMFYAMAEDVRHAGYALPKFTSYNGGEIPFAYPPLGFYLAAAVKDISGASMLDVFRFLPLTLSALTIPAFYLLARRFLAGAALAATATLFFALVPRAFDWEIAGGGLTRSLGLLLALLAMAWCPRICEGPGWRSGAVGGVLFGLTALAHPESGWFVGYSYVLFFLMLGRSWASFRAFVLAATAGFALLAPWLAAVALNHGADPFLSAVATGHGVPIAPLALLLFSYTEEPFFPVVAALGLIGLLASFKEKRYLFGVWLAVMFVLDPRKAWTYSMLPLTLLAALGFWRVVVPQAEAAFARRPTDRFSIASRLLAVVTIYLVVSAIAAPLEEASPLKALPAEEAAAMAWVSANVPADSRFLVISDAERSPWIDARSEWFPALSGRVSIATVQGREWLDGGGALDRNIDRFRDLQACADAATGCLEAWAASYGAAFTHVYLPEAPAQAATSSRTGRPLRRDCCAALRASLASSPAYRLLYEGSGARVYAYLPAEAAAGAP